MMRRTARLLTATAAVAALVALLIWLDRSSVEHANRLFHAGQVEPAEALYAARAGRSTAALYNAGTARLLLGGEAADTTLRAAAAAGDSAVAHRAEYNLGDLYLTRVRGDTEADSARALLQSSILRSRRALRLDPRNDDARWNLALAQQRLDSLNQVIMQPRSRQEPGTDETVIDLASMARGSGLSQSGIEPDNPTPSQNQGERVGASQGAREAWTSQDPGPLDELSARELLATVGHDPEQMIRGLIWSQRPDVEWWNSEPYPGGDW